MCLVFYNNKRDGYEFGGSPSLNKTKRRRLNFYK